MRALILLLVIVIGFSSSTIAAKTQKLLDLEWNLINVVYTLDNEKIIIAADELLKYKPKHAQALFSKARALTWLGRHHEALVYYDLAIKYKYKRLYLVYMHRAESLEQLGRLEEALVSYDLSINSPYRTSLESIYFGKDRVLMKLGRLGSDAQTIVDLEKKFLSAFLGRKWKEIIAISDELLKYRSECPPVHFIRAWALSQTARYEEALASFDLAIKYKYRPLGEVYYEKGLAFKALDRLEEALTCLNMAIEHGSDDKWTHFARNEVLLKLDRLGSDYD